MSATLALLAAHALGDFPLQPTAMARAKTDSWVARSAHSAVHAALTVVLLAPVTTTATAVTAAVAVGALHFLVDSRQWVDSEAGGFDGYPMAVDQTLHIATLYLVSAVILA